jgi:hypothetical protein
MRRTRKDEVINKVWGTAGLIIRRMGVTVLDEYSYQPKVTGRLASTGQATGHQIGVEPR